MVEVKLENRVPVVDILSFFVQKFRGVIKICVFQIIIKKFTLIYNFHMINIIDNVQYITEQY